MEPDGENDLYYAEPTVHRWRGPVFVLLYILVAAFCVLVLYPVAHVSLTGHHPDRSVLTFLQMGAIGNLVLARLALWRTIREGSVVVFAVLIALLGAASVPVGLAIALAVSG